MARDWLAAKPRGSRRLQRLAVPARFVDASLHAVVQDVAFRLPIVRYSVNSLRLRCVVRRPSCPTPHASRSAAEMMRRSLLTSLFVLISAAPLAAAPPVNPADAIAFMNQLWNRGSPTLVAKPSRCAAAEATVTASSSRLTSSAPAVPHRLKWIGGSLTTTAHTRLMT